MKSWLSNFWYYHKWHLFIGLFIVFLIVLSISQFIGREYYDYNVVLYTSTEIPAETCDKMALEFEKFGEDIDGNGTVNVLIVNCSYNSSNAQARMAQTGKFQANLAALETVIIITDASCFSLLDAQGAFDAFPQFTDKSEKAVNLATTPFNEKIKDDMPSEYFLSKRLFNEKAKEYSDNATILLRKMLSEYAK